MTGEERCEVSCFHSAVNSSNSAWAFVAVPTGPLEIEGITTTPELSQRVARYVLISNVKRRRIIVKYVIGLCIEWLYAAVVQGFIEFQRHHFMQSTANKRAPLAFHINS